MLFDVVDHTHQYNHAIRTLSATIKIFQKLCGYQMLLTDIWLDSRLKGHSIESKNTKTISKNYVQTVQVKS